MKVYIYGLYKEKFEYKTNQIDEGLSKKDFCKKNDINYSSFKAWKNYYENY